jgi:hypothetical protein
LMKGIANDRRLGFANSENAVLPGAWSRGHGPTATSGEKPIAALITAVVAIYNRHAADLTSLPTTRPGLRD